MYHMFSGSASPGRQTENKARAAAKVSEQFLMQNARYIPRDLIRIQMEPLSKLERICIAHKLP